MTLLSLRRYLGMTPSDDHGYDPTAARWLDSGWPEGSQLGAGQQAVVPQQRDGGYAVTDHERADFPAGGHAAGGHSASAHGTAQSIEQPAAPSQSGSAWPEICDQFGLQLLVLAEQLRASLNELEADEDDPERLWRLYRVDHAVTRMRLASRQLRTLAGRSERGLAGFTTSLLDVIRMASSAIERYTQVSVGRVTELAVLGYAADDVGALMSALLDNATRYSPGTVLVSCHLLEEGGVMFRIEDTGAGIAPDQVTMLNAVFAGPVPDVDERTGLHTGFPVVHRIARKHSIGVRLASRPLPNSGTVAMVTLPAQLLCEIPADGTQRRPARPAGQPEPQAASAETDQDAHPEELPRRERASLPGGEPTPAEAAAPTPLQQAAARWAFADDLSVFSQGVQDAVGATDGAAIEEGM